VKVGGVRAWRGSRTREVRFSRSAIFIETARARAAGSTKMILATPEVIAGEESVCSGEPATHEGTALERRSKGPHLACPCSTPRAHAEVTTSN